MTLKRTENFIHVKQHYGNYFKKQGRIHGSLCRGR